MPGYRDDDSTGRRKEYRRILTRSWNLERGIIGQQFLTRTNYETVKECGEYGRRHKPLLDAAINDIRIRFEGKTVEVEFNDTAPKPLQGFTVTAPVQILEHNTGCWWERTITARIRDGSTIPVVLDHVYWNWITGTPMHIHLDGIQRIRVIEDKHHQREENN